MCVELFPLFCRVLCTGVQEGTVTSLKYQSQPLPVILLMSMNSRANGKDFVDIGQKKQSGY